MPAGRERPGQLPPSAEVVVIGGGAMGTSVAFHLAEAGVDVLLLERDALASGSSGKPLGGVRAQFSDALNVTLGARSLHAYQDFTRRPGYDIGLEQVGYLFLLPTPADVELFTEAVRMQNEQGVPSRMLSLAEAKQLNPYIDTGAFAGASYSAQDGLARPSHVVNGYAAAAARHGATMSTGSAALKIETQGSAITGVLTTAGRVETSTVICCAGAWSGALAKHVGVELPIVPLRRQIACTTELVPAAARIPFTIDYGSTFYFHNAGPGLMLGFAEPDQEVGFDREYDERWLPTLRKVAAACAPATATLEIASGWAGLYEMTPDRNALIGEAQQVDRFLYAAGFSGHGFLQAPAVGEVVRDLYLHREPFVDVSPLRAERFAESALVFESNII